MSEQNDLDAPFDEWGDTLPSRIPKMSEQQDILHCPFCGSEAKAYASHYANLGEHWVICLSPNCGGKTHWWASREQAIAAWNQRSMDAELQRLQDRVHWLEGQNKRLQEILDGWQVETYGDY